MTLLNYNCLTLKKTIYKRKSNSVKKIKYISVGIPSIPEDLSDENELIDFSISTSDSAAKSCVTQ